MRVKHYARAVTPKYASLPWESLAIELTIGVICGVYGFAGLEIGLGQLAIPCLLVASLCGILVIHTLYVYLAERRNLRLASDDSSQKDSLNTD